MAFIIYFKISIVFFFLAIHFTFNSEAQLPACKDSFPTSLLPNSSFEEYSGCNPDYGGLLEGGYIDGLPNFGGITVNSWHSYLVSSPVSYYNYNCKVNNSYSIFDTSSFNNLPAYPAVHLPLPDSNGFIEIYQGFDLNNIQIIKTHNTYITTCLSTPLYAGQPYVFSFYFGFGKTKSNYPPPITSPSPFIVAIFGRADCPGFPLVGNESGCLAKSTGWVQLGTTTLSGGYGWVQGIIEFTPSIAINSIGIGPDCSADYGGSYTLNGATIKYYMDKFILAPKADFSFKTITATSGNPCTGNFILKAPQYPAAAYQWYKDGILIDNATNQNYTVPDVPEAQGNYMANISLPYNTCINTLPYYIGFSDLGKFNLGNDTTLCIPAQIALNASWPDAVNYLWQDGSTKPTLSVTNSGNYSVSVTDKYGCKSDQQINVTIQNCEECKLYMPSAFTPNQDGLNDVFRALPECANVSLQNFKMRIYNRYGQIVFTSNDIAKGWDGMFKNKLQETGSYIYVIDYAFNKNKPLTKKGVIQLLR